MLKQQFNCRFSECSEQAAIIDLEQSVFKRDLATIYQNDKLINVTYLKYDDEIVGYLTYKDNEISYDIYMLAVSPKWRGQKIGTELLKTIQTKDIVLEVSSENEVAQKFYQSHGFKQVRVIKNYYNGTPGLFLHWRKNDC